MEQVNFSSIDLQAFLIRLRSFSCILIVGANIRNISRFKDESIFICFSMRIFEFPQNFKFPFVISRLDCTFPTRIVGDLRNLFSSRSVVSNPMSYDSNKKSFWYIFFILFICVHTSCSATSRAQDEFLFIAERVAPKERN